MKVTIADLDVGNLHSLKKALEHLGAKVDVTENIQDWLDAEVLVLPGDGAFAATLKKVSSHKAALAKRIVEKPTLGICIGMHILFEQSVESPSVKGLCALPGNIEKLPAQRLPHMGWNTVEHEGNDLFVSIPNNSYFYFVHSYGSLKSDAAIAWSDYEGWFTAAVQLGEASHAVQFHPEKSGRWGLELLDNFLGIAEDAL
jgi:glutamine amidotransferase